MRTKEILACHAHTTPDRSCRQQVICAKLLMNTVINAFYIILVTLSVADQDASSKRQCCQSRRPVPQRWCPPDKEDALNCLQRVVVIVQTVWIRVPALALITGAISKIDCEKAKKKDSSKRTAAQNYLIFYSMRRLQKNQKNRPFFPYYRSRS